jgi:hypothetical protein
MVEKSFKSLPNVGAVHIAAVNAIDNAQRTWRARVRAGKMARLELWRSGRCAPPYQAVIEAQEKEVIPAYHQTKKVGWLAPWHIYICSCLFYIIIP